MSVQVVVSAPLSSNYDRRYVVVDEASGEVLDDAQGYGYKAAQNAHRAHAYKSMPPKKKPQRDAAKRRVQRWCEQHPEVVQHLEQAVFYAMKDDESAESELVRDMLAIVTSFAGRRYGQRWAKTKRLRTAVAAQTECGEAA